MKILEDPILGIRRAEIHIPGTKRFIIKGKRRLTELQRQRKELE